MPIGVRLASTVRLDLAAAIFLLIAVDAYAQSASAGPEDGYTPSGRYVAIG